MGKKAMIGIVVVLVILIAGYYGLSYYIFDQLTAITPECGAVWMDAKRDNTPTDFVVQFKKVDAVADAGDLVMASYEDVNFQSREDNVNIAGWYIPAPEESDQVVIVVHGHNGCKNDSTQLIPASFLHHGGFNVLMIDLRNHGASDVVTGRMTAGVTEYNDVLGAFDYLQAQGFDANNIGLLGLSNGATTSAIAFSEEEAIPALWLDSPFGNIVDVVESSVSAAGLPAPILRPGVMQVASILGVDLTSRTAEDAIQNHNERPIVITHGDADDLVPFKSGQTVFENAGSNATFLPVEGARHVEAVYIIGETYASDLLAFFTENLGN